MKKPDLIKQLANRINQPHVIESWIEKIERAAYKKGYADAQNEQCNIAIVSQCYVIVGWEFNNNWKVCDVFGGFEGEDFISSDEFETAKKFTDLQECLKVLGKLIESYPDISWYIQLHNCG